MQRLLPCSILAAVLGIAACGGSGPDDPVTKGAIVVGVTSELRAGVDIARLHAVLGAQGKVISDKTLPGASMAEPLAFPLELDFGDRAAGDTVGVALEAFGPSSGNVPMLTRLSSTQVVAGQKLLLPVRLEQSCVELPGARGPDCASPKTCIAGACADAFVAPNRLKPYTPDWASAKADACKPANAGAPIVLIGEGQSDYLPMKDYDVGQVEQGPQGGYHVWLALRLKNLRQSGSITQLTGEIPDLGLDIPPFSVIFTFDQDEGGYCKLYGLRFRLDLTTKGQMAIQDLLGHVVKVHALIKDSDGETGTSDRYVTLSKDFIGLH